MLKYSWLYSLISAWGGQSSIISVRMTKMIKIQFQFIRAGFRVVLKISMHQTAQDFTIDSHLYWPVYGDSDTAGAVGLASNINLALLLFFRNAVLHSVHILCRQRELFCLGGDGIWSKVPPNGQLFNLCVIGRCGFVPLLCYYLVLTHCVLLFFSEDSCYSLSVL